MKKNFFIIALLSMVFAGILTGCTNKVGDDRDSHGCIGSAGYSWCEEKQKCIRSWEENCTQENNAQIANPASEFCITHGGELEIRSDETGAQAGICKFSNGKECDEWAFMRGECDNK